MHAENCHLMTQGGNFFDITHTFKSGSSTYHVLGLRKDRPTYNNTYYIFNCTGDQHESTNESLSKPILYKRFPRTSDHLPHFKHRPLTAHHTTTASIDDLTTSHTKKSKSASSHSRTRTELSKTIEIDTTAITETVTKAMKTERQMLFASLRKEMNIKKRALLRSMKKEKEVLLQATNEANKNEEIIRLLEEQKNSLTSVYEKCVNTTTSSIDTLKQTLLETLDTHYNTSQTIEQLQLTLIQTIEQEVQKIILKNEEIFRLTTAETNAINQLQNTLVEKIENYSTTSKQEHAVINRLFAEQKQVLTDAVAQQQQIFSLDLIKQTMLDALNEQQSMLTNINNTTEHFQQSTNDTIMNVPSEQILVNNNTIVNKNSHSLPRMISSQQLRNTNQSLSKITSKNLVDSHFFKVSIRSPSSESAHLHAKLVVDGIDYDRPSYTLCQRDAIQSDLINCYIARPTKNGLYQVTVYAKTSKETSYRAAISIQFSGSNISQPITFPFVHQAFEEHQCILIEPFQGCLKQNSHILIHMIIPDAYVVKIRNGDDNIELDGNEYKNGTVKKKLRVRGDIYVTGCWDKKTDSTICVFRMV